jgi:hypothetical protein
MGVFDAEGSITQSKVIKGIKHREKKTIVKKNKNLLIKYTLNAALLSYVLIDEKGFCEKYNLRLWIICFLFAFQILCTLSLMLFIKEHLNFFRQTKFNNYFILPYHALRHLLSLAVPFKLFGKFGNFWILHLAEKVPCKCAR